METRAQDASRDPGPRQNARDFISVLVVDDQEPFRSVLCEVVAGTDGFTLIGEASSGESAIRAAQELSPRMVIMDKRMPGMGGMEAARVLTDRHPEVVVLLISVEEAPDPRVLRACGAAAFACKQNLCPALLQRVWQRHGGWPAPNCPSSGNANRAPL
jgi:two-component system, NarL family, invasion response regulator UvrY